MEFQAQKNDAHACITVRERVRRSCRFPNLLQHCKYDAVASRVHQANSLHGLDGVTETDQSMLEDMKARLAILPSAD